MLPGASHPVPARVITEERASGIPQARLFLGADLAQTSADLLGALRKVKTVYPGSGDWGISHGHQRCTRTVYTGG